MSKKKKKSLYQTLLEMGFYETDFYEDKWIYIDGEKSKYMIRSNGEVLSMYKNDKLRDVPLSMSGGVDADGYHIVSLTHNGKKHTRKVHRLVAEAFIPNDKNKKEVNHINGNKMDNRVSNLEWVTAYENTHHAAKYNLRFKTLDGTIVRFICIMLSTNFYSIQDIAIMANVSPSLVARIYRKEIWRSVSRHYKIENYKKEDHKYIFGTPIRLSDEKIHSICKDIVSNKYSLSEIANRNKVGADSVQRIYNGKSYRRISKLYDFSKYTKRINQFK